MARLSIISAVHGLPAVEGVGIFVTIIVDAQLMYNLIICSLLLLKLYLWINPWLNFNAFPQASAVVFDDCHVPFLELLERYPRGFLGSHPELIFCDDNWFDTLAK